MSVRDIGYKDYGINDNELANLLLSIRQDDKNKIIFLNCCIQVKPEIADDLYYSLARGVSYDDLKCILSVPIPKVDFYGYRRKAVATYRTIYNMENY